MVKEEISEDEAAAIAEKNSLTVEVGKLNDLDQSDNARELRAALNRATRHAMLFELSREFAIS